MSEVGQDIGWLGVIALLVATKVTWSAGHPVIAVMLGVAMATVGAAFLLAHQRLTRRAQVHDAARAAHPSTRVRSDTSSAI